METPFDITVVSRGLRGAASDWDVRFIATVTSTMDVARELAMADAPGGTVVVADEQTAGRGRLGRAWISRPGGNLYFTVLLRLPVETLRLLPMAAPLAVAEAIDDTAGLHAELKWPNDVQLDGKKCAGILIDSQMSGSGAAVAFAGIGINVNRDPEESPELRGIATSLSAQLRHDVSREALLAAVLNRLAASIADEPAHAVKSRWRGRLNTLGRPIRVRNGDAVHDGIAEDVGEDGSLQLRTADGSLLVLPAGEVTLRV